MRIELENLKPHSFMSVDRIDYMEVELNICYQLKCIDNEGAESYYEINLPKSLPGEAVEQIPFLEKKGWVFDLVQILKSDKK